MRVIVGSRRLPREIVSKPRLYISLSPTGLQVFFSTGIVRLVETALPVDKLQRQSVSGGRNRTIVMSLHSRWEILGEANIKIFVLGGS